MIRFAATKGLAGLARALVAVLGLALAALAQADEKAAASLVKVLNGISGMQATFSQQTVDGKGRAQPAQSGRMGVKRPGLFRWEVVKPAPQMVLTAGRTLWIYDPELMQATKQRLDAQVGNTPALLLSGDPRQLAASFEISELPGAAAGEQVFVLKPRGKDALFESMHVSFRGGQLVAMDLTDTLGQRTSIRFGDIRMNPAFAAGYFEFVPPKGTDIIDQI
ncbi:MAG TPA: outer membrane lipoprotein chaperone LolA [Moraxellaceae bacterium]|nr:outer membrane lipoprotein chaperone LolA [Moraxellaceae bacterium]